MDCLHGFRLAGKIGIKKLYVESASQLVIRWLIKGAERENPILSLIEECKSLLNKDWKVRVQFKHRKGNSVADFLIKRANDLHHHHMDRWNYPYGAETLVLHDAVGRTCLD